MENGVTSAYRREHIKSVKNDEFEALDPVAQGIINNSAAFYEGAVDTDDTPTPSSGERTALKRAMARFIIDSGIADARGWI